MGPEVLANDPRSDCSPVLLDEDLPGVGDEEHALNHKVCLGSEGLLRLANLLPSSGNSKARGGQVWGKRRVYRDLFL